jgi:ABC-type lipoprotein release transport system permease subunit
MTEGLFMAGGVLSVTTFLFAYRVLRIGKMDKSGRAILVSSLAGIGVSTVLLLVVIFRS